MRSPVVLVLLLVILSAKPGGTENTNINLQRRENPVYSPSYVEMRIKEVAPGLKKRSRVVKV